MSTVNVQFYAAVLKGIGAPVTDANIRALEGWQRAEGGTASYNPFNTTLYEPGATSYNSVGVRNYRSESQGILGTVSTLRGSAYSAVVAALRRGNNPGAVADAVGASPWGTPNFRADIPGTPINPRTLTLAGQAAASLAPGSSSIGADVSGAAGAAAGAIGGAVSDAFGGVAKDIYGIVLRGLFVLLGLGLVALGVWRLFDVGPKVQKATELAAAIAPAAAA